MELEIILFIFLILSLVVLEKIMSNGNKGFVINFSNMFFIALIAYTVLPIIDCIINEKHVMFISPFLVKCILMVLSITLGYVIGNRSTGRRRLSSREYPIYCMSEEQQGFWTVFWGIIIVFFIGVNIVVNRGGISNAFNSSYRESYSGNDGNIAFLLYSAMPYAILFNDNEIIKTGRIRLAARLFTVASVGLNMLMGNRNLAIMIVFAYAFARFKNHRFNNIFIYGGMLAGVIGLGLIAVMREHSIVQVLTGNAAINWDLAREYAVSFANGELGTMFAFERYKQGIVSDFSFPYACGFSYFVLPIINIVPRSLWPSKPISYADYFSHYAFGSFDGSGYGFSPIYEAEINFGIMWWTVFIFVGFFLARMSKKDNVNTQRFYNAGLMSCIILNFFRIDFTTCFKFFAMMWVFKYMFLNSMRLTIGKQFYTNSIGVTR